MGRPSLTSRKGRALFKEQGSRFRARFIVLDWRDRRLGRRRVNYNRENK